MPVEMRFFDDHFEVIEIDKNGNFMMKAFYYDTNNNTTQQEEQKWQ